MAKTASKRSVREEDEGLPLWKPIAWLLLTGAWAIVLASLVTFDAADPPTHLVWPGNDPVVNICGPVGAWLSYHFLKLFGAGVWVIMTLTGLTLGLAACGRRADLLAIRAVGALMIVASVSAFARLISPDGGAIQGLPGGLVGQVITGELVRRFSVFGTGVWLTLIAIIGIVVALDRPVIALVSWAFHRAFPAAGRKSLDASVAAGSAAARTSGGLVSALGTMLRGRAPIAIRLNDLDDEDFEEEAVEVKPSKRKSKKQAKKDVIDERVGGLGATEAFDPDASDEDVEDEYEDEDDEEWEDDEEEDEEEYEEDEEELDRPVDEKTLREKIAKLPVRFAATDRKLATEEDLRDLQGVQDLKGYRFPALDLLEAPEENFSERLESLVREQAEALESALRQYRIDGEVVGIESGPVITQYDVRLAPGTKVSSLSAVQSDVARALKAVNIRIVPNQAGRDTVGVEVPNPTKERVRLKELMSDRDRFGKMNLPMFLGKDAAGDPLIEDLTKMPHMLIAGTTGSGKSVCMNTIIMSFLYTKKPNELKLVLVDPKMVEMSQFKDIPHLMCPVVTEMSKAAAILEWACKKMDERYELLAEAGCRDISSYNKLGWEELKERFNPANEHEEARIPRTLPYMVFIIDELADLMMTAKEVEGSIIRIAQKARAVGIHLILATQRPQANVVTGLIKSNMPARISFKVASGMDSRIVLDQKGGELLLGQGDMLYLTPSSHKVTRAQGTLVDDAEIRHVVRFMRDVAKPTFERQLMQIRSGGSDDDKIYESENNSSASLAAAQEDPMFDRAVEIVLETKRGSVSLLQRRLAIGYTRASRLIDLMGIAGIISEHKGSVARDVLITPADWAAMQEMHERMKAGGQGELFNEPRPEPAPSAVDDTDSIEMVADDPRKERASEAAIAALAAEEERERAEAASRLEPEPGVDEEDEEEAEPEDEYEDEAEEVEDEYEEEEEEDGSDEPEGEYDEEEEEDEDAEPVGEEDEEEWEEEEEDGDEELVDEEDGEWEEEEDEEPVGEEDEELEYVDDPEYVDEEPAESEGGAKTKAG